MSSEAMSHQKSFDRNFCVYTPKISVGENDYNHYSRNYDANNKKDYENQNVELLKISDREYEAYNSHKVSPKPLYSISNPNTISKTENTSFVDQNIRIPNMKSRLVSNPNSSYIPLNLHHKQISSCIEMKGKICSESKTISHTAASSMNTAKAQF